MISLIKILLESEYEKKESAKKAFKTYEIAVVIRTDKKINKSEVEERIRGVEGVTIVKSIESNRLDSLSKRSSQHNYDLYQVKFVTNENPTEKINGIKDNILHSKDDTLRIKGVVSVSPDFKTIKKV